VIHPDRPLFPDTPPELLLARQRARRHARAHAVAKFCRLYWKPLFGLLVARKIEPAEAEDLVQGFLPRFIESDAIVRVDRAKGRFRDFLADALNHYLIDQRARAQTVKRGGRTLFLSLDQPGIAETLDLPHGKGAGSPQCDMAWAESILNAALERLEKQCADSTRRQLFRLLKPYLTGAPASCYGKVAGRLRRSPATLRSDMKRLRERFRENLRDELRRRVGPERLEQEWETLREILRGKH
jgi:DNA-directed RNA polymerase specialized sigma24 family protein